MCYSNRQIYKILGKDQIVHNYNPDENLISNFSPKHVWLVYLGTFDLDNFELTSEEKLIIDSYQSIKDQTPKNDYETYKLFKDENLVKIV